MSTMFGFVLCADDFAMTAGISRGILELLERGRLSATGAMTNRPHWPAGARELAAFEDRADLGVHLNLTCAVPLTAMPRFAPGGVFPKLTEVITAGLTGRLPVAEITAEIAAQLDAFEQRMGRLPDFIDGHQHVHGLVGVRRIFLDVIRRRYQGAMRPYIRVSGDQLRRILARRQFTTKALQVKQLSSGFAASLSRTGFAANDGFAGFSAFDATADYGVQFASYLAAPGPRHLVMCHPGYVDDELPTIDPVLESRAQELAFLRSDAFAEVCAKAGAKLVRMPRAPGNM